jgi:hypothetical protein
MQLALEIRARLADQWIPHIYEEKVRTGRTRSFELPVKPRENDPQILHTLLGVELKIGKARVACPDLATARYLSVFGRFGCAKVAVPYDITRLSGIADELETAWHRMLLVFLDETRTANPQVRGKQRAALIRSIRQEIARIGAGEAMPLFNKPTKQRGN